MMTNDDANNYASFGTALDPLDEDAIVRKKPIRVEDQIATDDRGRRRFHGAFTGGFSAGFFNTAGSRDGWAPRSFKSKPRKAEGDDDGGNAAALRLRPEDFMDEEDLGAFGIAPQGLKATATFETEATSRKRKAPSSEFSDHPLPGNPVLDQVFRPVRETIGVQLLKSMGWRPGQGIGPRLTKSAKTRRREAETRMYGCPKDKEMDKIDENEIDPKYKEFLFAPDDIPNFVAKPKTNVFGIGYKGLDKHIDLFGLEENKLVIKDEKNRKVSIRGQAFGVGVYEDDDDEDVYGKDNLARYDFALEVHGREDEEEAKKKRKKSRWTETVSDPIIEGFVRASTLAKAFKKAFPPPVIPKDFKPMKTIKKSRFEEPQEEKTIRETNNPSVDQRRKVLFESSEKTEQERPPPTDSVEQIQKLLATNQPPSLMNNFKPFGNDAEKQKRYEQFLVCLKNGRGDALPILQAKATMTEWEREREKVEFERASLLYQPLTTEMSSRFVSATDKKEKEEEKEPVTESKKAASLKLYGNLTREKVEWHPAKLLCVRFNIKHPYAGDDSCVGVAPSRKSGRKSKFDLFHAVEQINNNDDGIEERKKSKKEEGIDDKKESKDEPEVKERPPMDLFKAIFLDDSDSDNDDEDDKKEEDKKSEKQKASNTEKQKASNTEKRKDEKPWEEVRENKLRNPAPAQGIFANLDLDSLFSNKTKKKEEKIEGNKEGKKDSKISKAATGSKSRPTASDFFDKKSESEDDDELTFGPPKPKKPVFVKPSSSSSKKVDLEKEDEEEEIWEEKKTGGENGEKKKKRKKKEKKVKKKSKKKDKKKQHSSKHKKDKKHKKRKKKKKKKETSSSSTTSSSDDSSSDSS